MTADTDTVQGHVLLVDDDADFLLQQKLQFEAAGYRVTTADNAGAGLSAADAERPDAAVVDLMMETNDSGFQLCYQLKKRLPDLPIVMVTGVAGETGLEFDAATEEERAWLKADVVLAKPIRFEQLRAELKKLIKR